MIYDQNPNRQGSYAITIGKNAYIGKIAYQYMEQPFVVGKPVTGKYFIDRESELKKLVALFSGAKKGGINNVILLGLRRTGKSSILLNLKESLAKDKKTICVIFDTYGISTKERFARTLIDTVFDAYVKKTGDKSYKEKIKKLFAQGFEKLSDRISEFDVEIAEFIKFQAILKEKKVDEDDLLEDSLQYPEKLGTSNKVLFVIMIDEFQELLKWKEQFHQLLRKITQSQTHVAYVFCGSAPTVMKKLIYDTKSPFYKQLTEIHIGQLSKEVVVDFIQKRFKSVKINIDEMSIELMYQKSYGFADYIQRLGLQLFLNSLEDNSRKVRVQDVQKAYSEMLLKLDAEFSSNFATFSDLEREILIALANSKESPSDIATEVRKPSANLSKTLSRLVNADVVEKYLEGKYRISDPVFSDWLSRRYHSRI